MKWYPHPWEIPRPITRQMEELAAKLIRNIEETSRLIADVEGPTEDEWNEWFYKGVKPLGVDPKWFVF